MVNLGNDWDEILKDEFSKEYYKHLRQILIKNIKLRSFIQRWKIYFLP